MTKNLIPFFEEIALDETDISSIKVDIFNGALWRRMISEKSPDGMVSVTLSTGKTVRVNSTFLGLLRILAEELARENSTLH